jgi:O-antigen ligase
MIATGLGEPFSLAATRKRSRRHRRHAPGEQQTGLLTWLLAAVPVLLVLFDPRSSAAMGWRLIVLQATGVIAITAVLLQSSWSPGRVRSLARDPFNLMGATLVLWSASSALRSPVPRWSAAATYSLLALYLWGLAARYGYTAATAGRGLVGLALAGAVASLGGLAGSRAHPHGWVAGVFHDPQLLAGVLGLLVPALAAQAIGSHSAGRRAGFGACAAVVACGLLGTANRSAWLGAAVGLALVIGIERLGRKAGERESVHGAGRWLPVIAVGSALTMFLVLSQLSGITAARFGTLANLARDDGLATRLRGWQAAVWIALDSPALGCAAGLYPIQQALYNPFSREQASILLSGGSLSENAHNAYLQLAAELGFPGLILHLGLLVAFFSITIRSLEQPQLRRGRHIVLGAIGATAAQAVCAVTSPAWSFAECAAFWWLTMGVGLAAADGGRSVQNLSPAKPFAPV